MPNAALFGIAAASLFGIYADLAMNIASATNSSPQTTELFAGDRSETLWKWVKIGGITAIGFGALASIWAGTPIPLIATLVVGGVMGIMYKYALKWGQSNDNPSYSSSNKTLRAIS